MSKYMPKAELMFDAKIKLAVLDRDWEEVEKLFGYLECYFKLIEPIPPRSESSKELELVGHNEASAVENMHYSMSPEHAAWCVETLHVDPITLKKIDREKYPTYQAFLDRYTKAESPIQYYMSID